MFKRRCKCTSDTFQLCDGHYGDFLLAQHVLMRFGFWKTITAQILHFHSRHGKFSGTMTSWLFLVQSSHFVFSFSERPTVCLKLFWFSVLQKQKVFIFYQVMFITHSWNEPGSVNLDVLHRVYVLVILIEYMILLLSNTTLTKRIGSISDHLQRPALRCFLSVVTFFLHILYSHVFFFI